MKKKVILIISFLIISILVSSISVFATILLRAQDVEYTPEDNTWKVGDVEEALNDLYASNGSFLIDYEYLGSGTAPQNFPSSGENYSLSDLQCTGADGEWDNINWTIKLSNYTSKNIRCTAKLYDKLVRDFEYKGYYEPFTPPLNGTYQIELWGASGGTGTGVNIEAIGGKGAYTSGEIYLTTNDTIYIYVGGSGGLMTSVGWNGGGVGSTMHGASGGGATDIRLVSTAETTKWKETNSLRSRIMVAAGGGGAGHNYNTISGENGIGGNAGGLTGGTGITSRASTSHSSPTSATGGNQTTGGSGGSGGLANGNAGTFGEGGSLNTTWGGGGGSGYYGGGSAGTSSGAISSGGGGSSYISGHLGCVAITSLDNGSPKSGCTTGTENRDCSIHYSNKVFTNTEMIPGNQSMPIPNSNQREVGHSGDGFAKITLVN